MRASDSSQFKRTLLPIRPATAELGPAAADQQNMVISVIRLLAQRSERRPQRPWIDMRLSLITGQDFSADDALRGPETVSGWIQGRGIEALAGHARWLEDLGIESDLVERLKVIARRLLAAIRAARKRNGGHVYFFMSPEGQPLRWTGERMEPVTLTTDSPCNFSDLFTAKGLYDAARYLGDKEATAESLQYCRTVSEAVKAGRFLTDQQQLDPKNIVGPVPGRHSHGTSLIQIGAAAVLLEGSPDAAAVDYGLEHIRFILDHHVNHDSRFPQLQTWDFFEFRNDAGQPFERHGKVHSDPGHALEYVGFTLKFTRLARRLKAASTQQLKEFDRIEAMMPAILERNFANGFNGASGGIIKAFDLLGRGPINADMPWWSLPETIRASAGVAAIAKDEATRRNALAVFAACHNAFVTHYVKPELHLQAVQTRSSNGEVIDVIPATPDADPGYHTGLSLIDGLRVLRDDLNVQF